VPSLLRFGSRLGDSHDGCRRSQSIQEGRDLGQGRDGELRRAHQLELSTPLGHEAPGAIGQQTREGPAAPGPAVLTLDGQRFADERVPAIVDSD
jgi:hypothetical protein